MKETERSFASTSHPISPCTDCNSGLAIARNSKFGSDGKQWRELSNSKDFHVSMKMQQRANYLGNSFLCYVSKKSDH